MEDPKKQKTTTKDNDHESLECNKKVDANYGDEDEFPPSPYHDYVDYPSPDPTAPDREDEDECPPSPYYDYVDYPSPDPTVPDYEDEWPPSPYYDYVDYPSPDPTVPDREDEDECPPSPYYDYVDYPSPDPTVPDREGEDECPPSPYYDYVDYSSPDPPVPDYEDEGPPSPYYDYVDYPSPDPPTTQDCGEFDIILQIVVESAMSEGVCYLGFSPENKKLFRPLKNGMSSWKEAKLKFNEIYLFTVIKSASLLGPHSREDLFVQKWTKIEVDKLNAHQLYMALDEIAKDTVDNIFDCIIDRKYVNEGTDCPSAGILRCQGETIQQLCNHYGKRRLKIIGDRSYDFPYTAAGPDGFPEMNGSPVLILLGLARPFDGGGKFSPKRCYIMALRVVTQVGN